MVEISTYFFYSAGVDVNLNASTSSDPRVAVPDSAIAISSASSSSVDGSISSCVEQSPIVASDPDKNKSMSLEQQLQLAIEKSMKPMAHDASNDSTTVLSMIKKEMQLFEGGGLRGKNLQAAYLYLLTIPPSSVESERAFSSAGVLCTRIRTRLSDNVLDDMLFMRAYFQSLKKV